MILSNLLLVRPVDVPCTQNPESWHASGFFYGLVLSPYIEA